MVCSLFGCDLAVGAPSWIMDDRASIRRRNRKRIAAACLESLGWMMARQPAIRTGRGHGDHIASPIRR
jgi:hypothetical protein